ncbi:ANTAR domain-containing protein, partial [Mycobacterium sp.]
MFPGLKHQCGPDEAFDLLRLASQRANIKVHVLAERIVARLAPERSGS